ncbi:hypothetical protein BBJ28_00006147 [Nothophytophthora sp. Chile5]|nr:hypothetical protein BBJ28_00006147 [Nothophytophthora sp. Chile5]
MTRRSRSLMPRLVATGVLLLLLEIALLLAAVPAWAAGSPKQEKERTRPVLLVPGFASSQLQAWSHTRCESGFRKNLYRDVNIGDRRFCTEIECKLRATQGIEAISELDPGLVTGPLSTVWRSIIHDLVKHFELDPDELIVATYDWRLPPSKLQERDKYFYSLKKKSTCFEYTVDLHGSEDGGLVVIAHSMGNGVFRYFLEWLKHEVGRNHWQEWIDRYISAYFAVGSPLLGSAESLELITSGLTQGLPVTQREIRKLVVSFGKARNTAFLIHLTAVDLLALYDEVLLTVRFQQELLPEGDDKELLRNYTSADIASGRLFRDMSAHDPIFGELEKMRQKFYVEDDVLDAFAPWKRPPIASVYNIYGVNVPTKNFYEYQDTDTAGQWYQLQYSDEEGHEPACSKTGDGTVPYHSLSWAHTWLGAQGSSVRVTQTPQSVYFSAENITRVRAVRHATNHHAEYSLLNGNEPLCPADGAASASGMAGSTSSGGGGPSFFAGLFGPLSLDQITFFESSTPFNGAAHSVRSTSAGWWA